MSVKIHPNINASGFAAGIIAEFRKWLRGTANFNDSTRAEAMDILCDGMVDFVATVSSRLDKKFGRGKGNG